MTVDYKLLLLLVQRFDENRELCEPIGGHGFDVEFCFICKDIRVSFPLDFFPIGSNDF